jgi:hypothetical protein
LTSDGKSSIDCATARQYLSAFHDGELPSNLQLAMAEHLEGCPECARSLAEFREMSRMAAELPTPPVPAEIWSQLEKKLAAEAPGRRAALVHLIRRRRTWVGLATAAVVVVAVSTAAVVWLDGQGHRHVAVNFGRYLDEFARNPDAAQQVLLTNYEGRAVSYDEAATQLRYQPVTPASLPNGLSRKAVYLLRMPCCTCVQAVYQREDGEKLAIFEHVDDVPAWFGDRPTIKTHCNGMPTSLVEVDDRLAASWKRNGRCITVIGARDVEQVAELMAYLDDPHAENPPQ